jgi:hypothetical protein
MSKTLIAQRARGASAAAGSRMSAFLVACLLCAGSAIGAAPAATQAVPPAAPAQVEPAATQNTAADASATEPAAEAPATEAEPAADAAAATEPAPEEFRTLDTDVQDLKKEVLDLNKDLFVLEEELLFPSNTQVAVYVSMDVGTFFNVDSVTLKVDNKEVANYLYTAREAEALQKGGVHRIFIGNLKVGQHELVAFFTGKGPHERDYKRGATLNFEKGVGSKYVELKISDRVRKLQPEFIIKEWE